MSVGTSAVTVVESTQGPSTSTAPTNPQASSPGPECCIFHRRRQFGDWSDDEDSDAECDCPEDPPKGEQGGAGEGQSSAPAQ